MLGQDEASRAEISKTVLRTNDDRLEIPIEEIFTDEDQSSDESNPDDHSSSDEGGSSGIGLGLQETQASIHKTDVLKEEVVES